MSPAAHGTLEGGDLCRPKFALRYTPAWAPAPGRPWNIKSANLRLPPNAAAGALSTSSPTSGSAARRAGNKRPGLDPLMKAIGRREIDLVATWSVDRLGRSLQDLLAGRHPRQGR